MKWIVQPNSSICVEGASNVNNFRCDIIKYDQPDTLTWYEEGEPVKKVKMLGALTVNLLAFDCHSRLITNDLRKTLKADVYPRLIIHFISLERGPVFNGNTDIIKGWVNVELAGVTRKFEILYSFINTGSPAITLNGGRIFRFSDFNLKAPKKFAGIIHIKDEFSVNFRLKLIAFIPPKQG
jgi:hypothetical protein